MSEGKPSNLLPVIVVGVGIGLILAMILVSFGPQSIWPSGWSKDPRLESAKSFEAQYAMQKEGKASAQDLCARAKLTAEAFLQAEDRAKYDEWRERSRMDCAIADLEAAR